MLGIPLHRSSTSRARRSSSSPVSHRSSPAATSSAAVTTDRVRRQPYQRGSSTPSRLDRDLAQSKTTHKFNIRNLLAKISTAKTSPSRQGHDVSRDPAMTSRRSVSQRHSKRSLSASAPLRRARINDSTSSISGASTISQYYPSAVAQRLSSSPAHCRAGPGRPVTSLRSSAGSVWTAADSLPDSVSTSSLGSVFSLKSSSTNASPALWTPFTPQTGPSHTHTHTPAHLLVHT